MQTPSNSKAGLVCLAVVSLLFIGCNSSTTSVSTGSARMTFQGESSVVLSGRMTAGMTDDFNNDGRADVLAEVDSRNSSTPNSLEILLGNGDGTFVSVQTIPGNVFNLELIDFDADGNVDITAAISQQARMAQTEFVALWYRGLGDGRFADPVELLTSDDHFLIGSFFDVNVDGLPDLVSSPATPVIVYLNQGDGSLGPPIENQASGGYERSFIADMTADGVPDAVVVRTGGFGNVDARVGLMAGLGDGTFADPATSQSSLFSFDATPLIGQFGGDSLPDVLVSSWFRNKFELFINEPGAGLAPPCQIDHEIDDLAFFDPDGPLVVLDVNLDGVDDLVGSTVFADQFVLAINNGDCSFEFEIVNVTQFFGGGLRVLIDDLDADGDRDALAYGAGGSVSVLAAPGDMHGVIVQPGLALGVSGNATAADFDSDGLPDLLHPGAFGSAYLARGQGVGRFEHPPFVSTHVPPGMLDVADYDLDGIMDIVVADRDWEHGHDPQTGFDLLYGDGLGGFTVSHAKPGIEFTDVTAVSIADWDGDGLPQLIATSRIYGFAVFDEAVTGANVIHTGTGLTDLAVTDFDLDGRLDAAYTSEPDELVVLIQTPGGGILINRYDTRLPARLEMEDRGPHDLDVADLNLDGFDDIVVAGGEWAPGLDDRYFVSFLGNGDGTFAPAFYIGPFSGDSRNRYVPPNLPNTVALGDWSGDGFPDMVSAQEFTLYVFEGVGDGDFLLAHELEIDWMPGDTIFGSTPPKQALKLADLDGDGDNDIVVTTGKLPVLVIENDGQGGFEPFRNYILNGNGIDLDVADLDADGLLDIITANENYTVTTHYNNMPIPNPVIR